MKYLLLPILLIPSILFADTQTTGNQKFILPSTGVVDTSRNWGDKYNENWRIADSSMTNLQTAVASIQTDTTTLNTSLSGKINAGENNAGVVFTSMTSGLTAAGSTENSTRAVTITVGGEIVYSSATPPFFPGAWWSAGASSCTITKVQAVVQNPSLASAVFPFYAVQQSSWQWSPYGVLAVSTNTQRSIVKSEAIVVTSSNSFIVGVASAPVSNPASNLGLWFQYWCNP